MICGMGPLHHLFCTVAKGSCYQTLSACTMYYAFCLAQYFEREVEVMAELKKRLVFRFECPKFGNTNDLVGQFVLMFLRQRYLRNVMIFQLQRG